MAAEILGDVLNKFISIDPLLEWLSNQTPDNDINVFITHYKCSQVEFVSYFLNFLREQSATLIQSSCSVETPCKNSQLRKIKGKNNSTLKSNIEFKSDESSTSVEKKLDFGSLDSFPALKDVSARSRNSEKNVSSSGGKECPSSANPRRFRKLEFFSGKSSPNGQDGSPTPNIRTPDHAESTPKSTGKESVDIAEYFNDVVNLEGSPEFSPGFRTKRGNKTEHFEADRFRQNGVAGVAKSKSFDTPTGRSKEVKSGTRAILGDFIPIESENKKKSKVRKRINPTRVNPQQYEESSSFSNMNAALENGRSVTEERQMLRKECVNVMEQLEGKSFCFSSKNEVVPARVFLTPKKVIPNKCSATCVDQLKALSRIYSFVLDENYCQNIMVELCFVIGLLVIQDHNSLGDNECRNSLTENSKLLSSIHNCVYFAVETLWLQRSVLELLNLGALKLLCENEDIAQFNPDLKECLDSAYMSKRVMHWVNTQASLSKVSRHGNVSFECETDNKDNFTNEFNFHSFRKQRDLFYNILGNWEENHLSSDWVFSVKLDAKIRSLLSISSDPTNLLHLARLFRCQLVMSCCYDYRAEDESDEEILQLLSSVDPDKILRLRKRLLSTPKRQGPCPLPDFMGHQEFFKDFIISTSYSVFHYYLKNSLCDEILRLNDLEFSSDLEEDESCLDRQTQSRYLQQINIMCVLAKFLGFLEFLPYRNEKQLPDRVLNAHCAVRQNLLPLFDLESCLKAAYTRHRLTVTVPWIVSYLSMIDYCSAHLKTYQNVWRMLINFYRQLKSCKNMMNAFYLKLVLGWMFQLPNFPSDLFYTVLEDLNKGSAVQLCIQFTAGLDSYKLIEENILYSVCPFLSEINSILMEKSGCSVRHIRPVTQGASSTAQAAKQLQLRLEESFLHNQSSSTRRTIEFVTERVSSIAIKYLINDVIPKVKENGLLEISELCTDTEEDAEEKIDAISENCYKELISKCETESWDLCSTRSEKGLSALLSLDLDTAVREICTQIVVRQSVEKVKRWIQTHITLAIIKKEFISVNLKKTKKSADVSDISVENKSSTCVVDVPVSKRAVQESSREADGEICAISDIFLLFREMLCSIYEGGDIAWETMENSFKTAMAVLECGKNVSPAIDKSLFGLILDLLIVICVRCETELRKENLVSLFKLLKSFNEVTCPENALERVICPRNVALLLKEPKDRRKSWVNLGHIFLFLAEERLLTQDQMEAQLVSLLRRNWEKEEGLLVADMYNTILRDYMKNNQCDKFTLLLEYLIETVTGADDVGRFTEIS